MKGIFVLPRQRLPFFGLLLAAVSGILFASAVSWPAGLFFAASIVFLAGAYIFSRGPWMYISVACAFACVHLWQSRESTSFRLAGIVGSGRFVVTASGVVAANPVPYGTTRERFAMQVDRLEMGGAVLEQAGRRDVSRMEKSGYLTADRSGSSTGWSCPGCTVAENPPRTVWF